MKKSKKSPLLGYNNNVTFEGKVYHVQTEDSGIDKPHIITHLFTEGTILATRKTSYEHLVDDPDLEDKLKKMMRDQHKEMFVALRDGTYKQFAAQAKAEAEARGPVTIRGVTSPGKATAPETVERRSVSRSTAAGVPAQTGRRQSVPPPSRTKTIPPSSFMTRPSKTLTGSEDRRSTVSGSGRIMPSRPSRPPEIVGRAPSPPPPVKRAQKNIFTNEEPEKTGFGEDLISDRSLDEVIMSFLEDDLDEE